MYTSNKIRSVCAWIQVVWCVVLAIITIYSFYNQNWFYNPNNAPFDPNSDKTALTIRYVLLGLLVANLILLWFCFSLIKSEKRYILFPCMLLLFGSFIVGIIFFFSNKSYI